MRVLLTGGGTAGHINPALAIADIIRKNDPTAVIEFVGIATGKENELVPREGYRLHHVRSMGIQRSLSPRNIKAIWLALTSPYSKETVGLLKDFKPDIVIGTGGYACWPLMAAAARLGIPTALHESNSLPGLAVRRLQRKVDRIWINFEKTQELLDARDKVLHVGNPLRKGFGEISRADARRHLGVKDGQTLVLSFGGSLGAEGVNRAVIACMKEQIAPHPSRLAVHAAGKRDYEATREAFVASGLERAENCVLLDYIYDMPTYMAAADIIISRAGAMTLSELALLKKAAILIPSPNVTDNHQYKNAKTLADADAAILVEEKTLGEGGLSMALQELLKSHDARARLETNIASFANVDAAQMIRNDIAGLLEKKKGKD